MHNVHDHKTNALCGVIFLLLVIFLLCVGFGSMDAAIEWYNELEK